MPSDRIFNLDKNPRNKALSCMSRIMDGDKLLNLEISHIVIQRFFIDIKKGPSSYGNKYTYTEVVEINNS